MKILQVNSCYKQGSTGKIVYALHEELKKNGISSVVCYGRGEKISEEGVYKTCGELYSKLNNAISRFTGLMYGGCFFSTNKLISIIKKEKPDIVNLHCINGYFVNIYRLIKWLKKNKIKTVLTLHAEFMHTANCGHALECEKWKSGCGKCPRLRSEIKSLFLDRTHTSWKKMEQAFQGFDETLVVTSVSPWLMQRAQMSPILADKKHFVVLNGLDTRELFRVYESDELREKHNILKGEKVIFHATPDFSLKKDHIKGGFYITELAKMLPENIRIIIAGAYDRDITYPGNMIMLGKVLDQKLLAKYYSMADVTVIASKKETFSMITAESLACGTPVVGFYAGAPEQIALEQYSSFVEHGDVEKLKSELFAKLETPIDKNKISEAAQCYSKEKMAENYIEVYKKLYLDK